ncbi:hypothetical protein [Mesobacillus foraminis]|uniref:Uncharacterized protein n=1 Tax=Mesobacillus foraminis TaxID=279826 RepID=A0A4R2BHV7_9BACI|nr:hypothetical protein [Mesobacillus foraminis]TCN26145.1 hypothetical protein EV146_104253 [Mesobacillus foraminis]
MSPKPDLILDLAGVVATNFSPFFWEALASKYNLPEKKLQKFKNDVRYDLWTGQLEEREFWYKMGESSIFH